MGKTLRKAFDNLFGWAALIGLLALPVIVLLTLGAHRNIVRGKQVTMDRAKVSLIRALDDFKNSGGIFQTKQYGSFEVSPCDYIVVIGGTNYHPVLKAASWYQFGDFQSHLGITTNGLYLLLPDRKRYPKIIPSNYRVPSWQIGY